MASLAYRSNIRVNTISKSVASLGDGISRAQKSANKINSSLLTKNRESQKNLSRDRISFMKRREAVRRREQEDLVEASGVGGAIRRQGKVITSSTKGFLGRILDFIGTLMVGWLVQNLPTIVRMAEELIRRIQKLTKALGGFVGGVQQILSGFGSALSGSFGALVRFDFGAIATQMDMSMKQIETGFKEIENSIDYAMNILSQPFNFGVEEGATEEDGSREYTPGSSQSGSGGSWQPVLDIIGQAESRSNGYNAIAPGDYNPRLSEMTIAEANKSVGVNGGKGAIGRYQLTNPIGQAAKANLKPTDIFSPANQDKIAIALIEARGVTLEMVRTNPTLAGNLLSAEWAGLPVLSNFAGKKRGQSYYQGYKGNAATVKPEEVEAAFGRVGKPETTNRSGTSQPSTPASVSIDKSKRYKVGENIQGVGSVSSLFGPRIHPVTGEYKNHGGLDIGMNVGMYISCTLPCKVVEARTQSGYGKYTDIIIPSLNIRLRFAHLSSQLITNGEVKPGQPFARSGNSGTMTTGPHVHLEATTNMGGTSYGGDVSPDPYVSVLLFTPKPPTGVVAPKVSGKPTQAKISAASSTAATVSDQYTPERKGTTVVLPPVSAPTPTPMPAPSSGSSGGAGIGAREDEQTSLNRLIIQRMLLDLAYT